MQSPFFIVGASCKIKVNEVVLAYATDLSYSIRVAHALPKVLGTYEANQQEPLGYSVTGSFTVIRYTRGLKSALEKHGGEAPDGVAEQGNGVGSWLQPGAAKQNNATVGLTKSTRADLSLDPGSLYNSMGFTIDVIQKSKDGMEGIIARLRNCRIISSDFRLTKRGLAMQTFTFQACYADEDSFMATESGNGQFITG